MHIVVKSQGSVDSVATERGVNWALKYQVTSSNTHAMGAFA